MSDNIYYISRYKGCEQKRAVLVSVYEIPHSSVSDELLYSVHGKDYEVERKRYTDMVLVLLFLGDKYIPFTYLQPSTYSRREYYVANIGNKFNIRYIAPEA